MITYIGWSDLCNECKHVAFKEDEMYCFMYCPDNPCKQCKVCIECKYFRKCLSEYEYDLSEKNE